MEFPAYRTLPEPNLTFEAFRSAQDIHPLRGLKNFGAYSSKLNPISKIRIAGDAITGSYHH